MKSFNVYLREESLRRGKNNLLDVGWIAVFEYLEMWWIYSIDEVLSEYETKTSNLATCHYYKLYFVQRLSPDRHKGLLLIL